MANEIDFEAVREWYRVKRETEYTSAGVWHEQTTIKGKAYDITTVIRPDGSTGITIEVGND